MADKIAVGRRVSTLDVSPAFQTYSKVIIHIDNDTVVTAGNNSGRTLELDNPFGTQALANQILAKLKGYQYQPYDASGAMLDPAAELGDGVSVRNTYGGIYTRSKKFSRLMQADISAPRDEEINHEYKFETKEQRQYKREIGNVNASISIQADRITTEVNERTAQGQTLSSRISQNSTEIAAKVSQTGGNNSSFGWSLKSSEFGLYSGSNKVFYVNSGGAHVTGEITASSGKIGNFNIGSKAIYNNISSYGGTQTTGVYLGTDGIQLGQNFKVNSSGNVTAKNLTLSGGSITLGSKFKVTSAGKVTADSMTLTGTLTVGGREITAEALQSGAQSAYSNGSYWSGGAAGGYGFTNATSETETHPAHFYVGQLHASGKVYATGGLSVSGFNVSLGTISIKDYSGITRTFNVLTYSYY